MSAPDLFRALAVACEGTGPAERRVAALLGAGDRDGLDAADHTDLFTLQLPPYAAVHLGPEGMLGGEAADRVAGFWRALGLVPPPEPDHLAALLGLYATLLELEAAEADPARRALRGEARRALLFEHLLSWVPVYATAAVRVAAPGYRRWAELVSAALIAEAEADPAAGDRPLPLHLRRAPAPATPDTDHLDGFLAHLLAPVRSGLVITRADLARAARRLGLGLRVGERRFTLSALAGQDPGATFAWLAGEAAWWAEMHGTLPQVLGPIATFWRSRAERTGAALRLCVDAAGRSPLVGDSTAGGRR